MAELAAEQAALCVWADCTKLGRMANSDLNYIADIMDNVLSKKPQNSCGIVFCPFLISEKVPNGQRGEIRQLAPTLAHFVWLVD